MADRAYTDNANDAEITETGGIDSTQTSFDVSTVTGWVDNMVIQVGGIPSQGGELMKVTDRSTTAITVEREVGDSSGTSHAEGTQVIPAYYSGDFQPHVLSKVKTALTQKDEDTTVSADPHLTTDVPASEDYGVRFRLHLSGVDGGGFAFTFNIPTNATFDWNYDAHSLNGNAHEGLQNQSTIERQITGTESNWVLNIEGHLSTGDGGTFELAWAQDSSSTTLLRLRQGSSMQLFREH